MTTPIDDLCNYITATTGTRATEPDFDGSVDVHFFAVAFPHPPNRTEFVALITAAEHGEFLDMPLARLAAGPGYTELGGWLGSQDLALRFIAIGARCGLWKVFGPASLGYTGEQANDAAGLGMVMISPGPLTGRLLAGEDLPIEPGSFHDPDGNPHLVIPRAPAVTA